MELPTAELVFYASAWAVGFASGTARLLRDDRDYNVRYILAVGCCSAFFASGVVAVLARYDSGSSRYALFYLGLAALIGLLGKEQDLFLRMIIERVLKMFGFVFNGKSDNGNGNGNHKGDDGKAG